MLIARSFAPSYRPDEVVIASGQVQAPVPNAMLDQEQISEKLDPFTELEKLIAWRNEGKITQEEFEKYKSEII